MDPARFDELRALMAGEAAPEFTLEELLHRPAWHARAACRGMDPDAFFPARGESVSAALDVCAGCPVRAECFDFAMAQESSLHGVWAGTTGRRRRALRGRHAA